MITIQSREDFLKQVRKLIPEKSMCVEIGVLSGDFSQVILDILKPEKLILIDPFETSDEKKYSDGTSAVYSTDENYQYVVSRFEKEISDGKIILIKEYSHKVFSDPVNHEFEKAITGRCDFIYIDASHLYEDVKRDLNDWLPKLRLGITSSGIIAGHDYINHNGFGVIQAVDEFCEEHNFEIIIHNINGGDFALKRK